MPPTPTIFAARIGAPTGNGVPTPLALFLLLAVATTAQQQQQLLSDEVPLLQVTGPMYGHILRSFFLENDVNGADVKRSDSCSRHPHLIFPLTDWCCK